MPAKKTQTPAEMFQDAIKNMPVDLDALKGQMKSSAELSEKLAKIALEAAERSNELSSDWTKQTLANVGTVAKVQEDPSDFTKAMTDFASAQSEIATRNLNAFAEIAKAVQAQTIETLMSAGKDFGADASAAMQKATDAVSTAAKKSQG